jgi:predicted DsbA family dithiol-disulfide isomerase
MEATFFFDPACPFTWRASRWLVGVAAERDVTVHWRAFSLSILNGDNVPEQYRPMMAASTRALRLVEALRADHRDETVGAFYTELGTRTFEADTPVSDEIVAAAAEAAGVTDAKTVLDDESWDEAVRESHELAFGSAGPDIGRIPDREQSLAIWDAVVPLARSDAFFELKRGRS